LDQNRCLGKIKKGFFLSLCILSIYHPQSCRQPPKYSRVRPWNIYAILITVPNKYHHRNFKPQHFYHVFNRGAYKHKIFLDKEDYQVFTDILAYYLKYPRTRHFAYQKKVNNFQGRTLEKEPTVHLVTYCQMPNHFHLLLKQLPKATDKTNISNLLKRLTVTYSAHFRNKYKHSGSIFEGKFKSVTVDTSEQLLYLSKYIHLNPTKLVKKLEDYPHSSLPVFLYQKEPLDWLYPNYITDKVKNYFKFIQTSTKESETNKIETLILD
jgi:putative transposase